MAKKQEKGRVWGVSIFRRKNKKRFFSVPASGVNLRGRFSENSKCPSLPEMIILNENSANYQL